ncbi:hypothetical protein [Methylomonas sp. TEB]|uniref:hypothetical protein n=1 Tax=Methylomonas sp. TEB TaxID=3398229 RepID=UPI0039F57FF5
MIFRFSLILFLMLFSKIDYCFAGKADEILTNVLHVLVGNEPANCSKSSHNSNVTACITSNYRAGRAFIFPQKDESKDSYAAHGILGLPNMGGIYSFAYDSSPSGGGCCNYALSLSLCHEQTESDSIVPETVCAKTPVIPAAREVPLSY